MAVTALHDFGWRMERELGPRLSEILGEGLEKTASRFDTIDFVSPTFQVELKCRRDRNKYGPVSSDTYKSWVVPSTKIEAAKRTDKETVIFYYFEGDSSLWRINHSDVDWSTIDEGVPVWHTAPHYFIPKKLWKRV